MKGSADRDLAARAARGDDRAFREIYRRHARPVYWIAHRLLGSAPDAEDVVQETFVTAWRKLRELDLAGDSLLPWLATICRFHASNRLRSLGRHRTQPTEDTIPALVDLEQQVISSDYAQCILAEVKALSDLDAQIFLLCAVDGHAYAVAAERLGVGAGVVRNRLSRVRSRLRAAVGED